MTELEHWDRIEDKVDQIIVHLERVAVNQEGSKSAIGDHEERLRLIERERWPLPQVATLLALGSMAIAAFNFLEN